MAGINAQTGQVMDGWPHTEQSLVTLWTTPRASRVMRRYVDGGLVELLGQNMTPSTMLAVYQALAVTADRWEPRFKVTRIVPIRAGRDGVAGFEVFGEWRPRAHLGDFTSAGPRSIKFGNNGGAL